MKKITIITPSYNQGQFLEQTIESVLSQQYPNLEYMVIDGGSTDNSVEIIKKYKKHLNYWVSEKDNGQSDAINKGLKRATGDIINWLNSDDYYAPNALNTVAKRFEDDTILVVAGKSNIWKNNTSFVSPGTDIYSSLEKTIGWARIDQPETFFRKTAIDKMGFLNPDLHYIMDKEWWIRYLFLFGLKNIKQTNDVLVNFRIHDQSKTNNQQSLFLQETCNLYYTIADQYSLTEAAWLQHHFSAQHIPDFIKTATENTDLIRKVIHYFLLQQANTAYAQNDFKKAKKIILFIQPDLLDRVDQNELSKIKTRMKFMPIFIKKIWNKNG